MIIIIIIILSPQHENMKRGSFSKPISKRVGKRGSKTSDEIAAPQKSPTQPSSDIIKIASDVCKELETGSGWKQIAEHFWDEETIFICANPAVKHLKTVQQFAGWRSELNSSQIYTSSLRSTTASENEVTISGLCMTQKCSADFVYSFTFEEGAIRYVYLVWDTSGLSPEMLTTDGGATNGVTSPTETKANNHSKPLQKKKSMSSMRLLKKPGHEIQNDSKDTIPRLFQLRLTKRAIDRALMTLHEEGKKLHVSSITNVLLYREVSMASGSLIGLGLRPGKSVLFLSKQYSSSQKLIIISLSVMSIGGVVVPVNPESDCSSILEIIGDCKCSIVVTDSLDCFKTEAFCKSSSFKNVESIVLLNDPITDPQQDTTLLDDSIKAMTWNSFKEVGVDENIIKATVDSRIQEVTSDMPCITFYEHPLKSVERKGVYTHSGLVFSSALVGCSATIRSASPRSILSLVDFHDVGGWLPVISTLTSPDECELYLSSSNISPEILLRANPRIIWSSSPAQLLQLERMMGSMILNLNIEHILTVSFNLRDTLTARDYRYFSDEPGIPISMHFGNLETGFVGMALKLGSDGTFSLETCDGAEERGTPPQITHMGVSVYPSDAKLENGKRWVDIPLVRNHKNLLGGLDEIRLQSNEVAYPLERLFEIFKYLGTGLNSCYLYGENQRSLVLLVSLMTTSFGVVKNRDIDPSASSIHDVIMSDKWTTHITNCLKQYSEATSDDGDAPITGWAILPDEVSEGLSQEELFQRYPGFIKSAFGDSYIE